MTGVSRQLRPTRLGILPLLLWVLSIGAVHAQDANVQVEQFLNAFRGKPVAPVMPASTPAPSNSNLASPDNEGGNALQPSENAPQRDGTSVPHSCPPGMTQGLNDCVPVAMPPNAHRVSEDGQWQCNDGFLRYGTVCIPIQPSASH